MKYKYALKAALIATLPVMLAQAGWAGPMREATELCSDPLTTGPEKNARLPALGWERAPIDEHGTLNELAIALVIGFTHDMPDLEERFAAAPRLAANLARMAEAGHVSLWQKGEAILAVSIAATPQGLEHLACYLAMPPNDETISFMEEYGGIEEVPELELRARRFDETAIRMNPSVSYQMYSTWTRLTSDPARTALTDAYRLERVQQP